MQQLALGIGPSAKETERPQPSKATRVELILERMQRGDWCTLAQLARAGRCTETGASARLRDLRKAKHGTHVIDSKRLPSGLYVYRLVC